MSASRRRPRARFRSGLFAAAALALGFSGLEKAAGYALEGPYWQIPIVPMRVQMGAANIILDDGSPDWNFVVENALQLWNEQMDGMQFSWTEAAPGTATARGDGVNSIQFSAKVFGDDFGKNVVAVTVFDSVDSRMTEADILFNTAYAFNSYRGAFTIFNGISYVDLHRVALHELGHVIGLDHPDDNGQTVPAIMNAHVSLLSGMQIDDVNGAVALYGAPPGAPPPIGNAQILQISTRSNAGLGDNVMIGGFIIDADKQVIVRAIGPSLGALGVSGALQNPIVELHDDNGNTLGTNDDWRATQEQEIIDTGLPPGDDRESAIVMDLLLGNYTAIVSGAGSTTGVALVEIYDLEPENGKLTNISTRAHVGVGDDVTIVGFILKGPQGQRNLIRAVGPTLAALGVPTPLADPALDLYNGSNQILQSNDNFNDNRDATIIRGLGLGLSGSLEAGLLFQNAPGSFTAIMRGVNGSTGNGLIEVYGLE